MTNMSQKINPCFSDIDSKALTYNIFQSDMCAFKYYKKPPFSLYFYINFRVTKGLAILLSAFLLSIIFSAESSSFNRETPIVKAVKLVSPAVVNISSEYQLRNRPNPFGFGLDPFFDSFFKDFFDPYYSSDRKKYSLGSGVIIDGKRGYILTNAHVVEKTSKIKVTLKDSREFAGHLVGADPESDLAVIKIESKEILPSIEMGNSDDLLIGETVIAIGNPFGFSHTVTTGVISAINRSIKSDNMIYRNFIQTDASINPGNSGGPLLNINGELIGINTAIYAKAQGIGFAIPINKARRIVKDLIRFGEVVHAWIGIFVQEIDQHLANYLGLKKEVGIIARFIEPNSPAYRAGIKEGDILLKLNGKRISNTDDYNSFVKELVPGAKIKLELLRNGSNLEKIFKTSVFPEQRAMELSFSMIGVMVSEITPHLAEKQGISNIKGVVVTRTKKGSDLAKMGVKSGDIIRQIDEIEINTLKDFKTAIVKYRMKKALVVLVQRYNHLYYLSIRTYR